ncbi:MAG: hypothetical protein Q7J73_05095, partial [Dehalococcoidales bacterium]|nr:hypothetical protein [Dehalococcoidales bacterium]
MLYIVYGVVAADVAALVSLFIVRRKRGKAQASSNAEPEAEMAPPPEVDTTVPAAIAELSSLSEHEKRRFLNA